jgi:hypothetical protein
VVAPDAGTWHTGLVLSSGAYDVTGELGFLVAVLWACEIVGWIHCSVQVFGIRTLPVVRLIWVVPLVLLTGLIAFASPTSWLWNHDPASAVTAFCLVMTATALILAPQYMRALAEEFRLREGPIIHSRLQQMLHRERLRGVNALLSQERWDGIEGPKPRVLQELTKWNPSALGPPKDRRGIGQ